MKIAVFKLGCLARAALAETDNATVAAVLGRSLYLRAEQKWFCLGPDGLSAGPLNMLSRLPRRWDWRAQGVEIGAAVAIRESCLLLDSDLTLDFSSAATWTPARPCMANPERVRRGLAALTRMMVERVPKAGLGQLGLRRGIMPPRVRASTLDERADKFDPDAIRPIPIDAYIAIESQPVIAAASDAAAALDHILHAGLAGRMAPQATDAAPLSQLIGLGPGLTPSGDDYLGGALIALHLIGEHRLADRLWQLLQPQLSKRTHDVSAAHLAAAACGFGNAALHALLADVLTSNTVDLEQRVTAVDAVGHTSGWDGLAGALSVLRAWVRVSTPCAHARLRSVKQPQQTQRKTGLDSRDRDRDPLRWLTVELPPVSAVGDREKLP